ncbi:MAG: right-handed parallel beta-helix repeat-containing protein [Cytophagaceae bacterium]
MRNFLLLQAFIFLSFIANGQNLVTNNADSGPGSLRQAIINALYGDGTVSFADDFDIELTSGELLIVHSVVIDAGDHKVHIRAGEGFPEQQNIFNIRTLVTLRGLEISGATGEAGKECGDEIEVGGSGVYVRENGLRPIIENCYIHSNASHGIYFAGEVEDGVIRDCVISNNCNDGVRVNSSTEVKILNNKIGTNISGEEEFGNYWNGVFLRERSDEFSIENNLISGNGKILPFEAFYGNGLFVENSIYGIIKGNQIGTDATGLLEIGNSRNGVHISGPDGEDGLFTIATNKIDSNLISGNGKFEGEQGHGILVKNSFVRNTILNNIIGLDTEGDQIISNKNFGIYIYNCSRSRIGNEGKRNVISGNEYGIVVECYSNSIGNHTSHNFIGTDISGTLARPNEQTGVMYINCPTSSINNNLISGNGLDGIHLINSQVPINENLIGFQYNGLDPLGNGRNGILSTNKSQASIGNSFIGNNVNHGIALIDSSWNFIIANNFIGLNMNGEAASNGGNGIYLEDSYNNYLGYGGAGPGITYHYGNNISSNFLNGIHIHNGNDNTIINNIIGNNEDLLSGELGNLHNGILITGASEGNRIGSSGNHVNTICYNVENAVYIAEEASRLNRIQENSIYCNGYGINLEGVGNDNYSMPLESPMVDLGTGEISGSAAANSIIEVFKVNPGCDDCQGWQFIGKTTADGSGAWVMGLPGADQEGFYVFTATQSVGGFRRNTSEFSPCSVLPIELLSFKAENMGVDVRLKWVTATEKNNEKFELEYSTDGREFVKVGALDGAGNSSSAVSYYFVHQNPEPGIAYYRLKQIDYDGTYAFSPIRSVNIGQEQLFSLYPNPADDHIYLLGKAEKGLEVEILDVLGRNTLSKSFSNASGNSSFPISVAGLTPGVYFVHVFLEGQEPLVIRFVKR